MNYKNMKFGSGLSIIIPVFNEEKIVQSTISQVSKISKKLSIPTEIIVVNDGSTDSTFDQIKDIDEIILINHSVNKGYGASLKTGLKKSLNDKILILDADGTYPIEKIPDFVLNSEDYDLIIGARIKPGAKIPLIRRPAKFFIKQVAQFLTGSYIPDINSGMRLFRKSFVVRHWNLYPDKFSFTSTLTINSSLHNSRIKYMPIDYLERVGSSSIRPVRDFLGFLKLIFSLVVYFRPLKFFLLPGLILTITGGILGYNQIITNQDLGDASLLLILAGMQICFLGIIADMISKSR